MQKHRLILYVKVAIEEIKMKGSCQEKKKFFAQLFFKKADGV